MEGWGCRWAQHLKVTVQPKRKIYSSFAHPRLVSTMLKNVENGKPLTFIQKFYESQWLLVLNILQNLFFCV